MAHSAPLTRIFLLSHMRAYTSLTGHLLGSHPEINGYYEMHLSYASASDLAAQVQHYCAHDALKPGSRFLFDKLLHNDYALDLARLDSTRAQVLIALRPPEPTLRSIVNLFSRKAGNDPYANPAGAAAYYIERVQTLADFGARYAQRYSYFDAPLICIDPTRTLATLGDWLKLGSPLQPHYQVFAKTGVPGAGDSSPAMLSGQVIRADAKYAEIGLDAASLARAQQIYRDCRQRLIDHAAAALTD